MDLLRPIESLIPGVQGRVLGALTRAGEPLTLRALARLAHASAGQVSARVAALQRLGVVDVRPAGRSQLVRLVDDALITQLLATLADSQHEVLARMRVRAALLEPAPLGLTVFGSFARGDALPESDIDVLVVRPPLSAVDEPIWVDALGCWVDELQRLTGNPVALVDVTAQELPALPGALRAAIARDGIVLLGASVVEVADVA